TTSSYFERGANMRVHAMQVCPPLRYALDIPARTASSTGASSRMMNGDLPPSSSVTFFTCGAASSAMRLPAAVDPVNDTIDTSGCFTIASPTTGPVPVTRLNTPGGNPMLSKISASTNALSGAISLGFNTTVQPAASAGDTLATTWCNG